MDVRCLKNFFDGVSGRFLGFWMPTWQRDIVVTAAIGANDTALTIEDFGYDTSWFLNDVTGRHIFVMFPDGSIRLRKVTAAPSGTSITIDQKFGISASAADLSSLLVSFLLYVRFDRDNYVETHIVPGKANVTFDFITIPSEGP